MIRCQAKAWVRRGGFSDRRQCWIRAGSEPVPGTGSLRRCRRWKLSLRGQTDWPQFSPSTSFALHSRLCVRRQVNLKECWIVWTLALPVEVVGLGEVMSRAYEEI